jgi:hypothetical protein
MNKTPIFFCLLTLVLAFSACDKENLGKCSGGDCENWLHPNSSLQITEDSIIQNIEIISGNKLVFDHQFARNEKANIADDEYWDWIYFEIDPALNEFSFTDAGLSEINALFEYSCFCIGPFHYRIERGTISGTKKGDKWEVDIDVEIVRSFDIVSKSLSVTFQE